MNRFYHELSGFTICVAVVLSIACILTGVSILLFPSIFLKILWFVLGAGFLIAGIGSFAFGIPLLFNRISCKRKTDETVYQ